MQKLFAISLFTILAASMFSVLPVIIPESAALGTNGQIAFSSDRDGNYDIYTMNSDGTDQTNISNIPGFNNKPAWSPNGTKIAFGSDSILNFGIIIMNADGTSQTQISNIDMGVDSKPAWSPNGTKIAFTSYRDGNFEIYVMNTDGTSQINISNNPAHDKNAAWSPNGTKIAFTSNRDGNYEIYTMNTDGTSQINISNNPEFDYYPDWSPDGTKITFTRALSHGSFGIYVMNADGTGQTKISNTGLSLDLFSVWSPNGTKIAFTSYRDGNGEIYVMNTDGTSQINISNNPATDHYPSWQSLSSDTIPPTIIAPPDIAVVSSTSVSVPLGSPIVNDNLDPVPVVTNDAPATFAAGTTTTVTWTATDNAGNTASDTQLVQVLTPQQSTQTIIDVINDLVNSGDLNKGNGNALINKLDSAIQKMANNDINTAINLLNAFINQVNAFVNSGTLTQQDGQQLIDAANAVIQSLQ